MNLDLLEQKAKAAKETGLPGDLGRLFEQTSPDTILTLISLLREAGRKLKPFADCIHGGMYYASPEHWDDKEIEVGNFAHISWNDLQGAAAFLSKLEELGNDV